MSRNGRILLGLVGVAALVGAAAFAYIYVTGGSGEASEQIAAPTLEAEASSDSSAVVFEIVPDESQARFLIDEELFGEPNPVLGRTNQIAGQIMVNFDNPPESEVGVIRVNVRTLATDDEFRNRAIRGQILQSAQDAFEYATFEPTDIEGLPESITMNTPYTFTINGNLTIRDITQPVTFEARVTPLSEERIHGMATATVTRESYGLTIPNAPGVANVSENVTLEFEFVAQAVEE